MNILKETPEKYVKLDMEFKDDEEKMLIDYAKKHILEDKEALINYAFINILKNDISTLEGNINTLKEIKKRNEKQSTSNLEKDTKKMGHKSRNKNRK